MGGALESENLYGTWRLCRRSDYTYDGSVLLAKTPNDSSQPRHRIAIDLVAQLVEQRTFNP